MPSTPYNWQPETHGASRSTTESGLELQAGPQMTHPVEPGVGGDRPASPAVPPELPVALAALEAGLRPVPIEARRKKPIGNGWGLRSFSREELEEMYRSHPGAGLGLVLGDDGSGEGLIDLEVDDPEAAGGPLDRIFGAAEPPPTLSFRSNRGPHRFYRFDSRLAALRVSRVCGPDAGGRGGNPAYAGLEVRIGASAQGSRQLQTVVPPTPRSDGRPRCWFGPDGEPLDPVEAMRRWRELVAPLPEALFADLERVLAEDVRHHSAPEESRRTSAVLPQNWVGYQAEAVRAELERSGRAIELAGRLFGVRFANRTPSNGWHACHAVDREDEHPSAAVRADNGVYLDHGSGSEAISFFDLGVASGQFRSVCEAIDAVGLALGLTPTGPALGTVVARWHDVTAPTPGVLEAPDDPHRLARLLLNPEGHPDGPTLAYHRQSFFEWTSGTQAYRPVPDEEMRGRVNGTVKQEFDRLNLLEQARHAQRDQASETERAVPPSRRPRARKVTGAVVANVLEALRGMTLIPGDQSAPCWRWDAEGWPDPHALLPTRDALVDLGSVRAGADGSVDLTAITICRPTPAFFHLGVPNYAFDPSAPVPARWLRFLDEIFPHDPESIRELRKWFYHLMTAETRYQKILMMIGTKRGGKGTIAHVLTCLIGADRVASPALMDLAGPHGLQGCVGRSLLLISDARIAGSAGEIARVQERVLKISGEDDVEINGKYKAPYTTRLPARIVMLSNEIPAFRDASGAFRARARPLKFRVSFEGREDPNLRDELTTPAALAGILNWALGGRGMLEADRGFLVPASARDSLRVIDEMANPMQGFLEEWTDLGDPEAETPTEMLYAAYLQFCNETGNTPRTIQLFGRNLRATSPQIEEGSRRDVEAAGTRHRHLKGIRLVRDPDPSYRERAGFVPRRNSVRLFGTT